jgi:glutathione peroxidase
MAPLQVLEDTFSAQGFHVLGFYENDFGAQGGTPGQIDTCTQMYGVTFPTFAMDDVVGATAQPVWQWILAQPNPGPAPTIAPDWNFNKYLIAKDGTLVAHWSSPEYPGKDPANPASTFDNSPIVIAIKAELAK